MEECSVWLAMKYFKGVSGKVEECRKTIRSPNEEQGRAEVEQQPMLMEWRKQN